MAQDMFMEPELYSRPVTRKRPQDAFLIPCRHCGQRFHALDLLYHGSEGPYCHECREGIRQGELAELKTRSIRTSLPVHLSHLHLLLFCAILGIIIVSVVPTLRNIGASSESQELRTLFTSYYNTDIGQAARQIMNQGSLKEFLAAGSSLEALLNKRDVERLIVAGRNPEELLKQEGVDAVLFYEELRETRNREDSGISMQEAIENAAEVARVRQERLSEFTAEITKALTHNEYETNVGGIIKVISDWQVKSDQAN